LLWNMGNIGAPSPTSIVSATICWMNLN
jgi:hypothetical protein